MNQEFSYLLNETQKTKGALEQIYCEINTYYKKRRAQTTTPNPSDDYAQDSPKNNEMELLGKAIKHITDLNKMYKKFKESPFYGDSVQDMNRDKIQKIIQYFGQEMPKQEKVFRIKSDNKMPIKNTTHNNTNHFHGNVQNNGTIGAGNSGNIQQNNAFNEDKWEHLKTELEKLTVSSDDIQTLRNELQNIGAPQTEDDIPKNIWKWLGRVSAKVSEAALYSALSHHFGIQISP